MNEQTFRTQIAFLQKYYGHVIDSVVYSLIWEAMKKYSDEAFVEICKLIIQTFHPTSQVPFPMVVHFLDARGEINSRKLAAPENPKYLTYKEQLADDETRENIAQTLKNVKEIAKKWSFKMRGNLSEAN